MTAAEIMLVWDGDVDLNNVDEIRDHVDRAVMFPRLRHLRIDLGQVEFIDSLGLGMLIHAREGCRQIGAQFTLRNIPPRTTSLLQSAGLTDLFVIDGLPNS